MAKIKKAQQGISCKWSKGVKVCGKPIGEKVRDAMWDMKLRRDERKMEKSNRKTEKEAASKVGRPKAEGYERDFPEGGAAPGLWGETKGSKETRWNKNGGKVKKKVTPSKLVPKKKLGGKLAKQAATAIAMKKKNIKPKKSK